MKKTNIAVAGIALAYLVRQAFLLFQRIEDLEQKLFRQKQISQFFYMLRMKGNCGLRDYFEMRKIRTIAVYGTGKVYQAIADELAESADIRYFIDKRRQTGKMDGKPLISKEDIWQMDPVDGIIVTAVGFFHEIECEARIAGSRIIDIEDILYYDQAKRPERGNVW